MFFDVDLVETPCDTMRPRRSESATSRSSERSHLKVDTRFWTTVEKQFLDSKSLPKTQKESSKALFRAPNHMKIP